MSDRLELRRILLVVHQRLGLRTALLTLFAMLAFAANSVLCRMALGTHLVDPAGFTAIRLASGALALWLLMASGVMKNASPPPRQAGRRPMAWIPAFLLFGYAAAFSFAYVDLSTGTGALVLFGCVQATMLLAAVTSGERPHPVQWFGLLLALGGLVYLVFPGLTAPSPLGSGLMGLAGICWGLYSLRGRGATSPLSATTTNFMGSLPFAAALSMLAFNHVAITPWGALLAVTSGALTSGLGYVLWYAALAGLTSTRAATVQLAVPVLAAAGGILFLAESLTPRFVLASILILGGVALALIVGQHEAPAVTEKT